MEGEAQFTHERFSLRGGDTFSFFLLAHEGKHVAQANISRGKGNARCSEGVDLGGVTFDCEEETAVRKHHGLEGLEVEANLREEGLERPLGLVVSLYAIVFTIVGT